MGKKRLHGLEFQDILLMGMGFRAAGKMGSFLNKKEEGAYKIQKEDETGKGKSGKEMGRNGKTTIITSKVNFIPQHFSQRL